MGSEAPGKGQNVLKDEQNEPNEGQRGDRLQWLTDAFLSSFQYTPGETETGSLILDHCLSLGIFRSFDNENIKEETDKAAQESSEKKCDEVKKLEKRVEEIERKLSELSTEQQKGTASEAAAATKTDQKAEANTAKNDVAIDTDEEFRKIIKETTDFFYALFHFIEGGKVPLMSTEDFHKWEKNISSMSEEFRDGLFRALLRLAGQKSYRYCSFCDRFMFNARQTFMHIASPDHIVKIYDEPAIMSHLLLTRMIGRQRVDKMFEQEEELSESQQKKCQSMDLSSEELRPTRTRFGPFDQWYKATARQTGEWHILTKTNHQLAHLIMPYMDSDREMLKSVIDHIGNAKTRCLDCKLIFADATEYYEHLITFNHVSNAGTFDTVTLVVNMQMRETVRELPWPEMNDE